MYSKIYVYLLRLSFTVRLVGGNHSNEGRLEFYDTRLNSPWRAVCVDGFTDAAARVVCRYMGFRCV